MFSETHTWTGFVPARTPETDPFWDAANEGKLLLQRCPDCQKFQYHYRALCSHCWSDKIEDYPSNGRGKVWTYSVVMKNKTAGYTEKVPYVVALIELEGGMKVVNNVLTDDPEAVTFGTEVELTFGKTAQGQAIPLFKVVQS
jgi:uncharacterized OB-fold protein